jgi:glutamine amidotransferase
MEVAIVDTGLCNLGSIFRSFEECGARTVVSKSPSDLKSATHIVLPGVGSFADGMRNLREQGWVEPLQEEVLGNGIPLLGVCLGMQLLAEWGLESGETRGLGFIKGHVDKLKKRSDERIPHMGWNEIEKKQEHPILNGIQPGTNFYFVHSYCFLPQDEDRTIATTPYAGGFTSIVGEKNWIGVQFHPEKSQTAGFQIIRNFLEFPC